MLTERAINPDQLGYELGAGVRTVGPYPADYADPDLAGKTKVCYADPEADDDETLADAVDAHVADPGWVDPDYVPPPPPPSFEERVQAAASALIADALEDANTFADFKAAFAPSGQ